MPHAPFDPKPPNPKGTCRNCQREVRLQRLPRPSGWRCPACGAQKPAPDQLLEPPEEAA